MHQLLLLLSKIRRPPTPTLFPYNDALPICDEHEEFEFVDGEDVPDPDNADEEEEADEEDRKSTRLNSSHVAISYAVFCLKKKKNQSKNKSIISADDRTKQKRTRKPTQSTT